MMDFQSIIGAAESEFAALELGSLMLRMTAAVLIGAGLSLRPWRLALHKPLPRTEMIQAQLLLCVAAAVITAVIGNSVAKAFGLVGLGGFVRFRSGLKDPRDAAILFLVIGLGMACGHGSLELAAVGTGFVAVLLFAIDLFDARPVEPQRVKLSAVTADPGVAEPALRQALGARNVLVKGSSVDFGAGKVELDLEERLPGSVGAALRDTRLPRMTDLKWSTVSAKAQKEELV